MRIVFKQRQWFLFILIFIACLFSSMLGAQIFGISLNKLCLIPLMIYLNLIGIYSKIKINRMSKLLILFLLLTIFSSLIAFFAFYATNYIDYFTSLSNVIIQVILIYFPLLIGVIKFNNKKRLKHYYRSSILLVGKLNIIVGLLEFFLYMLFKYDLSKILAVFYGENYQIGFINLPPLGIFPRISGLCADSAFFGIILTIFVCFNNRSIWNFLAFLVSGLAISRSGMISIIICLILKYFIYKQYNHITAKRIFSIFGIAILIIICLNIPSVNDQMTAIVFRISGISDSMNNKDIDGTIRHILYIPKSIEVLCSKFNPIQFLFGFGPGNSGTILYNYHVMDEYLSPGMKSTIWVTECDFSDVLLTRGFVGTTIYLYLFYKIAKINKENAVFILSILIFGFMYNVITTTYILLIVIFIVGTCDESKEKRLTRNECNLLLKQNL